MAKLTPEQLDELVSAYIECALWTSVDDNEQPLDVEYDEEDLTKRCKAEMRKDCKDFLDLVEQEGLTESLESPGQTGHDFWLTRNGHGAGFWDRGLGEVGDKLTEIAKKFGSCDLYVNRKRINIT